MDRMDRDAIASYFEKQNFWPYLTREQQTLFLDQTRQADYGSGDAVLSERDNCLGAVFILKGILRISLLAEDGRQITIYRLHEGEACALAASCALSAITFDVQIDAEEDSSLLVLPTPVFSRLMEENIWLEAFAYRLTAEHFSSIMGAVERIFFMSLEQRVAELERRLSDAATDALPLQSLTALDDTLCQVRKAHVVKNTLNRADNYITLDQGSLDGIRPDMGVVDANGVVGIVYKTSPHYALVISLLSSKSSLSCKIVGSEYFGYLRWEGGDSRYAYLKDLPRHAELNKGDTVVTSGYSAMFPEGIMVGVVDDLTDSHDGLSYLVKVRLATDFGKVKNVRVLSRGGYYEQQGLEASEVQ